MSPRLPRHQRFEEHERRVQNQAALLLDDARLLPRFFRELQRLEDNQKLARILIEGGEIPPEANGGKPLRASADGHRRDRMRGTPIIAKGVSGTMRGTDPLAALIAKESRRRQ